MIIRKKKNSTIRKIRLTKKRCSNCIKIQKVQQFCKNESICIYCKYKCEHNRKRDQCKDCGGSQICEHNRRRNNCKDCGCTKFSYLEVHHKDENRNNNVLENLEIYCHSCHLALHKVTEKRVSRSQRGSGGKRAKGTRRRK